MYRDLGAAIASGDLAGALVRAVEAWREARRPELADVVDALSTRLGGAVPPYTNRHAEWIARAAAYDPLAVGPLVDSGAQRLGLPIRWADVVAHHPGDPCVAALRGSERADLAVLDRLVAALRWPDNPRLTWLLLRWLEAMRPDPHLTLRAGYEALADRLVQLDDARARPVLAWLVGLAPRLQPPHHQRTVLAEGLLARMSPPPAADPAAGALLAAAAAAPRTGIDALWREVARDRDNDAPRSVLADALAERGDPRGEMIALQLDVRGGGDSRAAKLLKRYRDDWLGDLGRVIATDAEYRRGFLHAIRVGRPTTPAWAYARVRGHRELCAVDTVRAHLASATDFAAFVDGVDHDVRRLELPDDRFVPALADARPRWRTRAVALSRTLGRTSQPALGATIAQLAAMMPDLEELELGEMTHVDAGETGPVLEAAPRLFPALAVLRVHPHVAWSDTMRALPLVELLDA